MKVENDDLIKLRDLLSKYKMYHDKLFDIEKNIEIIDSTRKELLNQIDSIKDAINQTGLEEASFKDYMKEKYGSFDLISILNEQFI